MRAFKILIIVGLVFMGALAYAEPDEKETEAIDFAHGLLQSGLYDMAAVQYQEFISGYPQSTFLEEANFGIAESYYLSKDFPRAVEAFKHFKEAFPNGERFPRAVLRIGQIQIAQGQFDDAIKELNSIDFQNKLTGELLQSFYFYLGKAHSGKNDLDIALTYFQKATQVPDIATYSTYSFQEIGEVHTKAGRWKEALDSYTKALASAQDNELKSLLTYKLGETLFLSGDYDASINRFREVLAQFPDAKITKESVANLLLAHLNLNHYDQLLNDYQVQSQFIKDEAGYFDAHFAAVRAYVGLQKYDDALKLLDKVLGLPNLKSEDQCKANLAKADIFTKQNKYNDSLALMEGALASCSNNPDQSAFLKAQSYFGLNQFDKALVSYELIKNNYATSRYANAALLGMAYAQESLGRSKEAGQLFMDYYAAEQNQSLKAQTLYHAALSLSKTDQTSKAIEHAQLYIKTFPDGEDYERAVLLLGDLYSKAGRHTQAIELLNGFLASGKAIQRPDAIQFLLGYNLQLANKSDEAIAAYSKVTINKDDPKIYFSALKNTAVIYLSQKKDAEAAEVFVRIINESDKPYLDLKTYIWSGEEYLRQEKYKEIFTIADKAAAHYPNERTEAFLYFKAEASRELKKFDDAAKYYDAILATQAKNDYTGAAHIGKGLYLEATNTLEKAAEEFLKVIEENPNDNTLTLRARYELGNVARMQNKKEEALKFYLLVGTIYQDDEYTPLALKEAAKILEDLNRKEEAVKIYQQIIQQYPASLAAAEAQEKLLLNKQ